MRYGLKHDNNTVAKYLDEKEKALSVSTKWKPHHRNECHVCLMHQNQKKAGAPKKKRRGNPNLTGQKLNFNANKMDIFGSLFHDSTLETPSQPLAIKLPESQRKHFVCDICKDLFSLESVMTKCDHYFCSVCLSYVFKNLSSNTVQCPTCESIVHLDDVQPIQNKFKEQLLDLNVRCQLCDFSETYQKIHHVCGDSTSQSLDENVTKTDFINCINVQSTPKSGIQEPCNAQSTTEIQTSPSLSETLQKQNLTLERSESPPLSKQEERLHTKLTKRKLHFAADKSTLYCKTGGQPLVLMKLKQARKSSNQVKSPLKRRRAQQIQCCRHVLAGRGRSATENQQSTELKVLKKTRRHVICRKAGVQHRTYMTKKLALAMKTTLGLSWSQHRTHKRYLREVGVNFDNESLERKERQAILSEYLKADTIDVIKKDDVAPESVDGFKTVKAPFVCH